MSWVMSALEPLTIRFRAGKIHIYIKSLDCHSMTRDLMSLNVIFWSYKYHKIHIDQIPWNAIVFQILWTHGYPVEHVFAAVTTALKRHPRDRVAHDIWKDWTSLHLLPGQKRWMDHRRHLGSADNRIHQTPADIYISIIMYLCTV